MVVVDYTRRNTYCMIPSAHNMMTETPVIFLFQEAKERALHEGISTFEEYRDLIENLLQEKISEGVFDPGEDLPTMQKDLEMLWPQLEQSLW